MMIGRSRKMAPLIQAILFGLLTGCAGKAIQSEPPRPAPAASAEPSADPTSVVGDSDSGRAQGLESVHFETRSAELDDEARSVLLRDTEILKSRKQFRVQLEGHCDQRGGSEQNFVLAERRAKAVQEFLIGHGVSAGRLQVISYGKERLLDLGASEESYRKNRRVNFVVVAD